MEDRPAPLAARAVGAWRPGVGLRGRTIDVTEATEERLRRAAETTARRIDQALGKAHPAGDGPSGRLARIAAAVEPALRRIRREALETAARTAERNPECAWCDSRNEIARAIRALQDERG